MRKESFNYISGNISEKELWQIYKKTKNQKIRNFLIEKYIPLVTHVAGKIASHKSYGYNHHSYRYYNIEFSDLVGFGTFGLIKAADAFDPDRNVKFKTYAYLRIRGAIIDELIALGKQFKRLSVVSLEEIKNTDIEVNPIKDYIRAPAQMNPDVIVEKKELIEKINGVVNNLSNIRRKIIILHYYNDLNFAEIGRLLRLSRERIRQIHRDAIEELRDRIKEEWR